MRKLGLVFCVISNFVLLSEKPAASEQGFSGNKMLPACKYQLGKIEDANSAYKAGECVGAIAAIGSYALSFDQGARFCPPEEATIDQAIRIVVKFLEQNPARLHLSFFNLAHIAMKEAWPCN
jgi:hypothetical protein